MERVLIERLMRAGLLVVVLCGFAFALGSALRFALMDRPVLQPNQGLSRYALVVGVSDYARMSNRPQSEVDARRMASALETAGYALVGGRPLINPDQTRLRYANDILGRLAEDGADVVVYFSGHAAPTDEELFLLARDAQHPPLVLYDEGGMRLEEIWSHPPDRFPGSINIIIETDGVRGLMGGGIAAAGTGLPEIETPPGVTVVVSDQSGALDVRLETVRQTAAPFTRWLARRPSEPSLFTRLMVEHGFHVEENIHACFEEVTTQTFEASAGKREPVIVRNERPTLQQRLQLLIDYSGLEEPPAPPPVSLAGLDVVKLVAMFEQFRAAPYLDIAGVRTIGFGHTGEAAQTEDAITREEGIALLYSDIAHAANAVDRLVTIDLTENQRNALMSLVFNIGEAAFADSQLLRRVNDNFRTVTASEFLRWRHFRNEAGIMEVSRGLQLRREQEAFLFMLEPGHIDPVDFIVSFEQFSPVPRFEDGCYQIGFGSPLPDCDEVEPELSISYVEALQRLRSEVEALQWRLDELVEVPLSSNQRVALMSFALDEGLDALTNSAVLTRLNNGGYAEAANAIRMYDSLTELRGFDSSNGGISRRAAEAALFFSNGGHFVGASQ